MNHLNSNNKMNNFTSYNTILQLQHQLQNYQFQYNDLQIKYELSMQKNRHLQSQCEMYQRELERFEDLNHKLRSKLSGQSNSSSSEENEDFEIPIFLVQTAHANSLKSLSSKISKSSNTHVGQSNLFSGDHNLKRKLNSSSSSQIATKSSDDIRNEEEDDDKVNFSEEDMSLSNKNTPLESSSDQNPKKRLKYYEWSHHYAALLEYYKIHGTCNVPARDAFECDLPGMGEGETTLHYVGNLGNWLRDNRQAKRGRGQRKASSEQIEKLQNLVDEGKLLWNVPTVAEESKKQAAIDWPRHYAALIEYQKQHGTCNIPQLRRYVCDLPGMGENGTTYHYEGNLGGWLDRQRQSRKGVGSNKITPEQIEQLQLLVDEGKLRW